MREQREMLVRRAHQLALKVRREAGHDFASSLDVYKLCADRGVSVRFVALGSMEGMYTRVGGRPHILLAAERPLGRRNFSCGHELGHHLFGHGHTVDELLTEAQRKDRPPDELLVDVFSSYLQAPALGVRAAFARRCGHARKATPADIHTVANEFNLGYTTMLTHLLWNLADLDESTTRAHKRVTLPSIRSALLNGDALSDAPLYVADRHWRGRTIDLEVGTTLVVPRDSEFEGALLQPQQLTSERQILTALRPGVLQLRCSDWSAYVRIAPKEFVGLAQFRHLPEEPDED